LTVQTVVVPHVGGVLSAYGLLAADESYDAVRTHQMPLTEATTAELDGVYADLFGELPVDTGREEVVVRRSADLRYRGQSFELTVDVEAPIDTEGLKTAFDARHERVYGYRADEPVEIVNLRATAAIPRSAPEMAVSGESLDQLGEQSAVFEGTEYTTPVYRRPMTPGTRLSGPAVLEQDESTTVVPPAWEATVRENGSLVLTEGNS
jgi:N-methylhydantoinase A